MVDACKEMPNTCWAPKKLVKMLEKNAQKHMVDAHQKAANSF